MRATAIVASVCLSAAALVWIGYTAIREWQRAATMVAMRNSEAAADLLESALARDMRAAQTSVLAAAERDGLILSSNEDLLRPIASALARYPYLETFFAWRRLPDRDSVAFFARADRFPSWLPRTASERAYPVVETADPATARQLADRLMKDGWQARRFSIFEMVVGGATHQNVAVLSYADPLHERVTGGLGFMVDLAWAKRQYFDDIVAQVGLMERGRGVRFAVLDEREQPVSGGGASPRAPQSRRAFPVLFFDP
ncbi:MAG TPA: hypothetical protein VFA59_17065, partial [Vicinamibacterales bacterium]|nr:hypothetical protein [Vicinamibacterales bacterium]